jgi:hypothetical protein
MSLLDCFIDVEAEYKELSEKVIKILIPLHQPIWVKLGFLELL